MTGVSLENFGFQTDLLPPFQLCSSLSNLSGSDRGNTPIPSKARLGFVSGCLSIDKKHYDTALKNMTTAYNDAQKGKDIEILATSLIGLGYTYSALNQYQNAKKYYQSALEHWKKIHEKNMSKIIPLLIDLSIICRYNKDYSEAYRYIEEAKEILDRENPDSPQVQSLVCNLANIFSLQGKVEESIELYNSARLALRGKISENQELKILNIIIRLYKSLGNTEMVSTLKKEIENMKK